MRLTIACIVAVLLVCGANARIYVVAPGGSDSDSGTLARPLATVTAFNTRALAGDTCYLRTGTYTHPGAVVLTADGATGRPICLFAYPGERPVVDGRNAAEWSAALQLRNASWWHIRGLEITGTTQDWVGGVLTSGTCANITLEQLDVHHNMHAGVDIGGNSSDILVLNCDSHHNVDTDYEDADGFQATSGANGTTAERIVFRGCRAWNNADDGYDFFFTTAGQTRLENCWAFRNGLSDAGVALGNGNGFKLGGSTSDPRVASCGGVKLVRCVSWGHPQVGFDENTDNGAVPDTLYHCTGYNNRGWRDYDFDCGLRHVFRNCLTFQTNGVELASSDHQSNSWNLGTALAATDFVSLNDAGADGPRGTSGALPVLTFLRPAAGRALVDKGQDIGLPFAGQNPISARSNTSPREWPRTAPCPRRVALRVTRWL